MVVKSPERTVDFMTRLLGFKVTNEQTDRLRLTVNGDEPGKTIEIVANEHATAAKNGLGTVHHVAMAISEADEQVRLRQQLLDLGYNVTAVLDRQYFQSIYFREPGGVLFEVATVKPGFMVDEDMSKLGCALKLPPWEESNRKENEAGLPAVEL
jgi:glyoxalase family protein